MSINIPPRAQQQLQAALLPTLPKGARTDFDLANRLMGRSVRIGRTDRSTVSGKLTSLAYDEEVRDVVATIVAGKTADDRTVEKVMARELAYITASASPSASRSTTRMLSDGAVVDMPLTASRRMAQPTIVTLPANATPADILAALIGDTSSPSVVAAIKPEPAPTITDAIRDFMAPSAADEEEYLDPYAVSNGSGWNVTDLIDEDALDALDRAIMASTPDPTPENTDTELRPGFDTPDYPAYIEQIENDRSQLSDETGTTETVTNTCTGCGDPLDPQLIAACATRCDACDAEANAGIMPTPTTTPTDTKATKSTKTTKPRASKSADAQMAKATAQIATPKAAPSTRAYSKADQVGRGKGKTTKAAK